MRMHVLKYHGYMMLYGVGHIATGLALIVSFGHWNPSWHAKVSMLMARRNAYDIFRSIS